MPFRGLFEHTLDDRGRVALPARYRQEFESGAVLTLGPDGCVVVYTQEGFLERSKEGASDSSLTRIGRMKRRVFDAFSFDVELDRQGRILVPAKFSDTAGLDGPVVIAGVRECLEIWNPERWEKVYGEAVEAASSEPAAGE
jgi:MraZ protein